MPLSKKAENKLWCRTVDAVRLVVPPKTDSYVDNPLPEEIAKRVVMNAQVVERKKLRDQILIILADYRNHSWAARAFEGEGTRQAVADQILAK